MKIHLKNKHLTINISTNPHTMVNQILNAICINLSPSYYKLLKLSVKVESIYRKKTSQSSLDDFLSILNDADLEVVSETALGNIPEFTELSFTSLQDKQVFMDKWFSANNKIKLHKGKLRFQLNFLDELVEFIRNSLTSNSFTQDDIYQLQEIITLVEMYDDELVAKMEARLNQTLINLRGNK